MQEWIRETLNASEFGLAVLPAAFLMGLLASVTSCCTPAVLGAIAGYSGSGNNSGRRANLLVGTFFLLGTIAAVTALGAVAGFAGQVAGAVLGRYWKAFAGLLAILFGLVVLNLVPFRRQGSFVNARCEKEREDAQIPSGSNNARSRRREMHRLRDVPNSLPAGGVLGREWKGDQCERSKA